MGVGSRDGNVGEDLSGMGREKAGIVKWEPGDQRKGEPGRGGPNTDYWTLGRDGVTLVTDDPVVSGREVRVVSSTTRTKGPTHTRRWSDVGC